ncbi:histidine kinase [Natronorubrum sp. A-ect3]|uniref:histidine kinase n=1 Tax=Natronorubrum sp. A-ect3 TaxID=3242698 RepID=UPI00359CDC3C
MASKTATPTETRTKTRFEYWQAGLLGGVGGGLVFGVLMTMTMQPIIEMAIPGMYGLGPSLAVGWAIHMFHSVVLGVGFAILIRTTGFEERLGSNFTIAAAGLAYGVVLWLVLASFVMPAWVGVMTEMTPPVPDWSGQSLMGHAVYGVILGLLYALLAR